MPNPESSRPYVATMQNHRVVSSKRAAPLVGILFGAVACAGLARPPADPIVSFNGRISASVDLDPIGSELRLVVRLGDREVVRSGGLGMDFVGAPPFGRGLEVADRDVRECREVYECVLGQRRRVVDDHRELILTLRERNAPHRTAELHVRVHDDGVSYRWRFVSWPGKSKVQVSGERVSHVLAGNPSAFPLYRKDFRTSHEGAYTKTRAHDLIPGRLIDLPLLFADDDGRCVAFTEADVRGFPHGYLERAASGEQLHWRLSPRLDDPELAARVTLPFQTPWRVLMIGDDIAELLESDLPWRLCEPPSSADTSWIHAGKQTWHWWNGTVRSATEGGGMDFATMRDYIDFCADHGIRYHAITGQDVPWYVQSRKSVLPSPDADVLVPRPELMWTKLLAYARRRGVDLRLWVHWKALRPKLDAAFALYERWGITGVMVDFLDRDDQEMVEFCERVLRTAFRHHLTVQFHGSFKPTGLRRTWPNLVNQEGSRNLEVLKWSASCDPDHDLITLCTRGLAGPLDYHLGGFRAVKREEFEPRFIRPNVLGTRARALAYYVVLYNPLPMVCDYPAAYAGQPGFAFLRDVPTTWDESRVLSAAVGEYVVWARRSGSRWYVGALTNWSPRDLVLALDFLGPGNHTLRLLADPDGTSPPADNNALAASTSRVTGADSLHLRLAPGGGAVAVID